MNTKKDTFPVYFEKTVEWLYVKNYLGSFGAPLAGLQEEAGDALVSDGSKYILIEFKKSNTELVDERKKYLSTRYKLDDLVRREKKLREEMRNANQEDRKKIEQNIDKLPSRDELLRASGKLEHILEAEFNARKKATSPTRHPHFFIYAEVDKNELAVKKIEKLSFHHYWGTWVNSRKTYIEAPPNDEVSKYSGLLEKQDTPILNMQDILIDNIYLTKNLAKTLGYSFSSFITYIKDVLTAKGGADSAAQDGWMFASVLGVASDETPFTMTLWEFCYIHQHRDDCQELLSLCEAFARLITIKPDDRPPPSSDNTPGPTNSSDASHQIQSESTSSIDPATKPTITTPSGNQKRTLAYPPPPFVKRFRR